MKALSIASIFAIGLAGTACSQASEAPAETDTAVVEAAETAEASVDASGFNLGLPTDVSAPANDGFNLALPSSDMASTDGFNLGTDIAASNGLAELPEIAAPLTEEAVEPAAPEATDDEPIIRLD